MVIERGVSVTFMLLYIVNYMGTGRIKYRKGQDFRSLTKAKFLKRNDKLHNFFFYQNPCAR